VLDTTASLAVIVGATIVLFQWLNPRAVQSTEQRTLTIPSQPVSLDGAMVTGDPRAKAALMVSSDFECPYCARFSLEVLPELEKRYIQPGHILFAFRHLPIRSHRNAEAAALAATCASEQQKFSPFHDLLFANPKDLDSKSLDRYAAAVGIERSAYDSCLARVAPERVKADTDLARQLGVTGTPAFLIGTIAHPSSLVVKSTIAGARPLSDFVSALDAALAGSK
jgi:protein-disulfide isomerase